MTIVDGDQVKKVRDTLALTQARAGKIQAFDQAASQLAPAEQAMALLEAGHRLRQADQQLIELKTVTDALEQLEQAGAYRAVVLEVCIGDALPGPAAYLALIGQPTQIVAGLLPGVDAAGLQPGDEVEVVRCGPDQFAVRRRVGRHMRFGAVARVDQLEGPNLLRVALGNDYFYLRPSAALAAEIAGCDEEADVLGRFVSFEAQLGMAFSFFGEPERESLVLREVPSVQRDELIVQPSVSRQLEEDILLPARHPELAKSYGIRPAHFLCFSGPPGLGKTHAARWVATELDRPVYLISGAEIADMWYGGTEAKLRARLDAARSEKNGAVLVWDEADAMLTARGRTDVGVENRVVSLMLSFTDGFESTEDVLVILTTNRPDLMDSALMRALRATPVVFGRPDARRTRALFELYLRDKPCADSDAARLARTAVQAVFAERECLADLVLRDSSRAPVMRAAAVSGALVRATCESAQKISFVRHAKAGGRGRRRGILQGDLLAALDDQFGRVAEQLSVENVEATVTIPRDAVGNVVAVEARPPSQRHRYLVDPDPPRRRSQAVAAS